MAGLRVGTGGGLRWWPILLFVLYLGYYWISNQHEVPISGRTQLVDLSREQESALGLQSYRQILAQERVVRSGPQVEAVREIGRRLVAAAREIAPEVPWQHFEWEFNLVESEQANAFALPGGKVAIYTGILPITANMIRPNTGGFPCGGQKLEETGPDGQRQCRYDRYRETLPGGRSYEVLDHVEATPERCALRAGTDPCAADNFGPVMVPEGHVFMMGDNRDDSLDSRFPVSPNPNIPGGVGMVPIDNLQGRALISFFSTDGSAEWLLPWTWFTAARWSRFGITYP